MEYAAGRNTSRINPAQRRNRKGKTKKPATESTSAQGSQEYQDLYSPDQNCNITVSHLSVKNPDPGPMVGAPFCQECQEYTTRRGINRHKTVEKALKPGGTGSLLRGVKRRLRTLGRHSWSKPSEARKEAHIQGVERHFCLFSPVLASFTPFSEGGLALFTLGSKVHICHTDRCTQRAHVPYMR